MNNYQSIQLPTGVVSFLGNIDLATFCRIQAFNSVTTTPIIVQHLVDTTGCCKPTAYLNIKRLLKLNLITKSPLAINWKEVELLDGLVSQLTPEGVAYLKEVCHTGSADPCELVSVSNVMQDGKLWESIQRYCTKTPVKTEAPTVNANSESAPVDPIAQLKAELVGQLDVWLNQRLASYQAS